jgi:hypothetical protein
MFDRFFRKWCSLFHMMWSPQVTLWQHIACCISKATCAQAHGHTCAPTTPPHTHTHRNMQYLLLSRGNMGFVNAPQCYGIRTLPLLCVPLSFCPSFLLMSSMSPKILFLLSLVYYLHYPLSIPLFHTFQYVATLKSQNCIRW